VNAKDKDGATPLDAAIAFKHIEIAGILRKHGGKMIKELETTEPVAEPPTAKAPDISIHDAARTGNIEAIKQHIAAGTHVDSELITGWTPLYFAAQAGYTEIAELLLSKGADVNAKTATGDTPLDQAIGFKHTEIVDLLRKHGGKHLTFHNAVLGGDVETVKEFLAAGTDVNAMTDAGHTPLDLANPFRLKSTELADLLRKHGGKTGEELKAEGK
jgi:ankyrin repeat protein